LVDDKNCAELLQRATVVAKSEGAADITAAHLEAVASQMLMGTHINACDSLLSTLSLFRSRLFVKKKLVYIHCRLKATHVIFDRDETIALYLKPKSRSACT
jgi:hypothetical protein